MGYAFKIDPLTNDLIIPIEWVSGAELVAQRLNWRFRTQKGEWLLDLTMGLDYLGEDGPTGVGPGIMTHNPDLGIIRALFVDLLMGTEGVSSIETLTLDFDRRARHLTVDFRVLTDEGDLVVASAEAANLLGVLGVLIFVAAGPFVA